jgi:hypothetical protein
MFFAAFPAALLISKYCTATFHGDWMFVSPKSTRTSLYVLRCWFFQNHEHIYVCSLPTLPLRHKSQPIHRVLHGQLHSGTTQKSKLECHSLMSRYAIFGKTIRH